MASRENQGLHIALILLVMLTIGLCLLSFVFYSKAENRRTELEGAKGRGMIMDAFRAALADSREREFRLGNTVVGPQRDDLLLTVAEGDALRDLDKLATDDLQHLQYYR